MPILIFMGKRFELTFRISAPAHVDQNKNIAVLREVNRAFVVAVPNVGSKGKDNGQRLLLIMRPVYSSVEVHTVSHRDLESPDQIDVFGLRFDRLVLDLDCGFPRTGLRRTQRSSLRNALLLRRSTSRVLR